jgi:type III secretory pathway component EscT
VVFVALMLKELFIGLTLTLVVGMVFEAAMSAGRSSTPCRAPTRRS